MRCALFGPMPGSLPSSSMRSWTGPSNKSEPRKFEAAEAAGEWPQLALRHHGDLMGGIPHGADGEVLQRLDGLGVDDLGVDCDGRDFATALHGHLHQTSTGLTVNLGDGEGFL